MPGYRKLQKIITQRRLSLPSKHSELPPHQPVIGKPKGGATSGTRIKQRFQWPAEAFRKFFKSEIYSNFSELILVLRLLTETCFHFHKKVRLSAKRGLLKVASEQKYLPSLIPTNWGRKGHLRPRNWTCRRRLATSGHKRHMFGEWAEREHFVKIF